MNDLEKERSESLVEIRRLGVLIDDDRESVEDVEIVIGGDYLQGTISLRLPLSRINSSRADLASSAALIDLSTALSSRVMTRRTFGRLLLVALMPPSFSQPEKRCAKREARKARTPAKCEGFER